MLLRNAFIGILLFVVATPALAQENATVYIKNSTDAGSTAVSASVPLPVTCESGCSGGGGGGNVNLTGINTVTPSVGNGATDTGTLRVTVSSDSTGSVTVKQGTPSNLQAEVGGLAASGASVSGNPVLNGGRAQNAEQTAVTNGQAIDLASDLAGKLITMPFANKENFVSGTATATTGTNTSLIAAQASGIKIYLTGFSCYNSGATTETLLFTSGSAGTTIWATILPAGGGSNGQIIPPVSTATATALFMTTGGSSSTMSCSVTGYAGT